MVSNVLDSYNFHFDFTICMRVAEHNRKTKQGLIIIVK